MVTHNLRFSFEPKSSGKQIRFSGLLPRKKESMVFTFLKIRLGRPAAQILAPRPALAGLPLEHRDIYQA
jgi:hypothetical protein